jgi:hypothetical protein
MIRKASIVIGIAAAHFALSKIIVFLTMQMGMFAAGNSRTAGLLGTVMVAATRVLYFPVITLPLYSRKWFPGHWLYVPMVINSLLWAVTVYGLFAVFKRMRAR